MFHIQLTQAGGGQCGASTEFGPFESKEVAVRNAAGLDVFLEDSIEVLIHGEGQTYEYAGPEDIEDPEGWKSVA